MKTFKNLIIIISILLLTKTSFPQVSFNSFTDCPMPDISTTGSSAVYVGGIAKPHRTDLTGNMPSDSLSRFHILIVFVQFANESLQSVEWPIDSIPTFMNNLLAINKNSSGNYWDRYNENTELLSDWFHEVSKGRMHVTGRAFNVILDSNDTYYANAGMTIMNNEIYQKLENLGTINWLEFDNWRKDPTDELYYNEPDNFIDMIFKVHRHRGSTGNLFAGSGGYASLGGSEYSIITGSDTIMISPNFDSYGSGLTIFGTVEGPVGKIFMYNVARHEYGHYLFGSFHVNCGIMGQGDAFLSPWEAIKLGYYTKQIVDYDYKDYSLADYSARTTAGEILEVPISGTTEFFLIANRRKISRYDVMMLGDSAKGDPFKNVSDLGKGIYIYHIVDGYSYSSRMDLECADGLFNWQQFGYGAPDWDPTNYWLPILKPVSVSYENEITCVDGCPVKLSNCDDRNVRGYTSSSGVENKWFSSGAKPDSDKVYTNTESFWTSRSHKGDRYDAWNIGYNQVFSPYSSPSTKDWNDSKTGIFIYYSSLSDNIADLKIYRADSGSYNETQILSQTPPSKPMGLVVDYHLETENIMRPILTWNHNREPDMLNTSNNKKKYKIWRATSTGRSVVPTNYNLHKTVEIDSGTAPSYIDTTILAVGSGWPGMGNTTEYPVRYKIQAVDKYQDTSVRSDFDVAIGLIPDAGCAECAEEEGLDNINSETELPKEFKLYSNYPNPFNPVTNIKFDLPKDVQVSIKIYDIAGREVKTLVNEFKTAGRYSVTFSGADFASGVYYYIIKAGEFEQVRKMILLK